MTVMSRPILLPKRHPGSEHAPTVSTAVAGMLPFREATVEVSLPGSLFKG